jgi:uncharacterized membrane protein YeaQ/YmgE (transglycosylase-associated protein family)
MVKRRRNDDRSSMAIATWVLLGGAMGIAARWLAGSHLPLGRPGATIAGALGAFCGATLESLAEGASRFEVHAGSIAGAAAGAVIVLVLLARAGVSEPLSGGRKRAS